MFRKLFIKIKRYFFYKRCGFYPEDFSKLIYVQKLLDKIERRDKSYNDYLKEYFNAKQQNKEDN